MFLPSVQACGGLPNSENPGVSSIAAAAALDAANMATAENAASSTWLGLLSRDWQSYAGFGPSVAYQLRNGQPSVNPASIATGVILQSSDSSGAADSGTSGDAAELANDPQFIATFGSRPSMQVYNGPRPAQGSVLSLVVGGNNRPSLVGPGRYPAATPRMNAGRGSGSSCSIPAGVSMTPAGESDTSGSAGISSPAGSIIAGSGVGFTLAALLGLAGLCYLADRHDKKKGF